MPAGFQGTAPWLLWQDRQKTMCCLGPKSTHTQPCRQLPGPRTCALCWCTSRDTEFPVWGMLPSGPHFLRTRRRRFGFEVHPAKPTTKQWACSPAKTTADHHGGFLGTRLVLGPQNLGSFSSLQSWSGEVPLEGGRPRRWRLAESW